MLEVYFTRSKSRSIINVRGLAKWAIRSTDIMVISAYHNGTLKKRIYKQTADHYHEMTKILNSLRVSFFKLAWNVICKGGSRIKRRSGHHKKKDLCMEFFLLFFPKWNPKKCEWKMYGSDGGTEAGVVMVFGRVVPENWIFQLPEGRNPTQK